MDNDTIRLNANRFQTVTASELRERGWTPAMIRLAFGRPDLWSQGPSLRLVRSVESTHLWQMLWEAASDD